MSDAYRVLQALCRQSFGAFTEKAFSILKPDIPFEWSWHVDCIAEHMQAQFEGDISVRKLVINIPPRCLKSIQVAQIYPAWVLGKEPSHQIIGASYAHTLAEANVVGTRRIMQSEWYLDTFGGARISQDQNQKDYFTTTLGGQYKGTGIGGTITGFGAKTLIIDDPINPNEAASDTVRLSAINEMRQTLFSRFNKYSDGRLVLIMQRLHESDPSGEMLRDGGCYHLKLPAQNRGEGPISYSIRGKSWVMEPGDLLTDRLNQGALDELTKNLTEMSFVGQYLQEPVPVGGGEFKASWMQHYQTANYSNMNVVILVDAAGGDEVNRRKKKNSDWTVMIVIGLGSDNNYYVIDMVRDRLGPTERIDTLFILHRKWNSLCGKSPKVGYEKYGMMTDTHYIREKQARESYNFSLIELGGRMMKEERIRRLIPDMQNGRWFYPYNLFYYDCEGRKFDLIEEMRGEMSTFPRGRWDDILDAKSRIYEPELFMVFPRVRVGMAAKAIERMGNVASSGGSWEDF